jgi:integrase
MARPIAENTEHKHMYKRGNVWWIQAMRNGVKFVMSTEQTDLDKARTVRDRELHPMKLKDNRDIAATFLGKIADTETQLEKAKLAKAAMLISDAWDAFVKQPNRPDSGVVNMRNYKSRFNHFVAWIHAKHPEVKELRHVTQEHADAYVTELATEVSASTYNRYLNVLTLVWRILFKVARLTHNPWKETARKRFVVHSRRELTVEELGRIIEAAKGEMKTLIAFGIYTGLRLGDCANLNWSNIDMVKGILSIIPSKTARRLHKRITIPLHKVLWEMLNTVPSKARVGYVLPECHARFELYDGALSKEVQRLFRSVNIDTTTNYTTPSNGKKKRNNADCGFHSLRHTFVSLCAAGGVPLSVVQSLVGHGNPAMTQHYTHIGLETAQNAIALLPSVTGKKVIEEKNDAKLEELKKLLTGLTDIGLEELLKVAKHEISTRKKAKKTEPIEVKEIAKKEKTS